ncbi:UPF0057-domain-containing protein [Westerdykella ornata]|uniref:UPF0057-domain-containing protein n=1 Tax=Westerdykella ornata TaxID=318751 RepID=A0A6A6J8W3_WESOR|nr:UPF0057-domain-containing protein [Westerdykella ornata]KAF2273011.1 UPF0057-domain-containing protein [Westerdykella ornata]
MCGADCFLMLLSVLFPPIGVWVKRGVCSADSLINIALCCLGFLPGLLHAWYIILKYPDPYEYEGLQGGERAGGTVTYFYVAQGGPPGHANYGTVGSQPSAGQFPGQQESGVVNAFPQPKANQGGQAKAQPQQHVPNGEGSSQPSGPPPTYADVIKGDHKVQGP